MKKKKYIKVNPAELNDFLFELFIATHDYLEENNPEFLKKKEKN